LNSDRLSSALLDAVRETLAGEKGGTDDRLEEAEHEPYGEDGGDVEREGQTDEQLCRGYFLNDLSLSQPIPCTAYLLLSRISFPLGVASVPS
jgi:hypothetical protein